MSVCVFVKYGYFLYNFKYSIIYYCRFKEQTSIIIVRIMILLDTFICDYTNRTNNKLFEIVLIDRCSLMRTKKAYLDEMDLYSAIIFTLKPIP